MVLLAVGYLKDPEEACDVVMHIFERLITNTTRLDQIADSSEEELRSYLMLVTKHRCLDYIKVNKNRMAIQGFLKLRWSQNERNKSIDAFEEEAILRLKAVLADQESRIFDLHLQGFSNEEIATELSISYNTVRNTLTNARNKIRKVWDIFMS